MPTPINVTKTQEALSVDSKGLPIAGCAVCFVLCALCVVFCRTYLHSSVLCLILLSFSVVILPRKRAAAVESKMCWAAAGRKEKRAAASAVFLLSTARAFCPCATLIPFSPPRGHFLGFEARTLNTAQKSESPPTRLSHLHDCNITRSLTNLSASEEYLLGREGKACKPQHIGRGVHRGQASKQKGSKTNTHGKCPSPSGDHAENRSLAKQHR